MSLALSNHYPEIYGEIGGTVNVQHYIIQGTDDAITTAPIGAMIGTLANNTMYRYGAPSFHYCGEAGSGDPNKGITACTQYLYTMDAANSLWVTTYVPGLYTEQRE